MSVEEVSSTLINFSYESASNIVITEGTQTTEGTNAAQSTLEPNQNANTDTTVAENQGYQPKKRLKTSHVRKSFKEVKVGTKRKAECIYCKHHFAILPCGVTTHLKRHVEETCPRRPANQADKNQQRLSLATIHENSESVTAVENFRYDQTKVREAISHWMIVCEKAICTADHIMFTNMIKAASPFYQRVTRANSTTDLFTTYESFKKKLKQDLKHVQRMSVTTDLWKSSVQTLQYMVVTGHFVDKKGEFQKCILNFCGLEPPHTGIGVSDALYKCLVDWDVERKIWSITLDNASYNDAAVRHLKDTLSYQRSLPLSGELFHVRCCAHIINIMVQYGLKEIEDTIESVRESIKYISGSQSRVTMFRDIAQQLRLSPKKLGLDCKTRWNSTYDMISMTLELKAVFPRYKDIDSSYQWLPSEQDWLKVKNVCEFLELFSYVTTLISGSSYPTVNLLLPELWGIKLLLKDTLASEDGRMKAMAAKMLEKFDKYWGSCNLVIAIAAILDPRNKFKFVEVSFKDLYTDINYHAHVQLVRDKLYALYNEYAKEYKESNEANQTEDGVGAGDAVSTTTSVQDRKRTGRAKFDSLVRGGASSGSSDMRNELDGYLDAHLEGMDDESEFNVIDWWKKGRGKYKILSKMACEIMAIPITSVASEAAFSAGGRVIDSTRASLGQNTVEALLCSQDWLRTHYRLDPKSASSSSLEAEVQIDLT